MSEGWMYIRWKKREKICLYIYRINGLIRHFDDNIIDSAEVELNVNKNEYRFKSAWYVENEKKNNRFRQIMYVESAKGHLWMVERIL